MSKECYFNPTKKEENKMNILFDKVEKNVRERIVCRFRCEEDFNEFLERNKLKKLNITRECKYIDFRTKEKGKRTDLKEKNNKPHELFNIDIGRDNWEDLWIDMPEVNYKKEKEYARIDLYFESKEQAEEILNQKITENTTSVWCPKLIVGRYAKKRVVGGEKEGKYPIYVVSKSRPKDCTTSLYLSQMEVHHYVVVEPCDIKSYKEFVENDYAKILELDMSYKNNYDTFDDLGDTKSKGPGAARNFCWDHSISNGFKWHWVMDDNATGGFNLLDSNRRIKCITGAIFKAAEDFVDRFSNIAISGLNYSKFCPDTQDYPPYVINTRIYSFLLIRNDIPYRWRGRYNEDTDLSLRVLKDGWCTVQFNSFLANKATTQTVKGGNTEVFYSKEGTYPKSKMLQDMHPDVAKVVWKFHRWHHEVNYRGFKQRLKYKPGINIEDKINDYGMIIIDTEEKKMDKSRSYLEEKYKKEIEEKRNENKTNERDY